MRVPKVEPPEQRSLEQSLLVRLYSKGLRLSVNGPNVKFGRIKGSGAAVGDEERGLVEERVATFMTMLRFDRTYGAELIRSAHGIVARRFPAGTGCDLSGSRQHLDEAHAALDRESMHGVWYSLDRYVEGSLKIIEEHRGQLAFEEAARG